MPSGWVCAPLNSVAVVQTGLAKGKKATHDPVRLPYLRVANVQDGFLDLTEIKEIEVEKSLVERYLLREGDVLLTEGGDFDKLGRGHIWRGEIPACLHQNHVFAVRVNRRVLAPRFFAALAASPYGRRYFLSCAKQTTNLASVNSTQLRRFPVLLPPLAEQLRIIEVLTAWDEAIAMTDRLVEAKQRRDGNLMRQALVPDENCAPRMRLASFSGEWRHSRLRQLFRRVTARNTVGNRNVLTASARRGLVSQAEYFHRSVAGASLDSYYLLRKGEFAYNRSRSAGYPMGAIKRLDDSDVGIVSTLYVCLRLVEQSADSDFYMHFFEAGGLDRGIARIANEGARAHGLLNVAVSDFFDLDIPVPPLEEQRALATFCTALDEEVDLVKRKLSLLQEQKKGLMQQLMTGKVRVCP